MEQIKKLVLKGELKVGDRLPGERELAEKFEVGRSSVREALKVLSLQGLVSRTTTGTIITSDLSSILEEMLTLQILLSNASYIEVSQTRETLEVELTGLAAAARTEQELSDIKQEVHRMEQAVRSNDLDAFIAADMSFHQQIAVASKNSVMIYLYKAISELIFRLQKQVSVDRTVLERSCEYHREILKCMEWRDAPLARSKMREHLKDIESRLDFLDKSYEELSERV